MSGLQISAWVMVFFSGLWAGGILIFAVERTNLWRRMPVEQYAVDFRRSVKRVDPMMPILGGIAGLASIYFALNSGGTAQLLAWSGTALMAIVIIGSIAIAEPMNTKFRRLPEGEMPPGITVIRDRWRAFHNARTIVALATLACMAGAAIA